MPKQFLSWNYVTDILSGRKKLKKVNQVKLKEVPPKST